MSILPLHPDAEPVTVGRVIAFYRAHRAQTHSIEALTEKDRLLDLFMAFLGSDRPIVACKAADLMMFLENPRWRSDWTRLRIVRTINVAFNFAARMDLIAKNPFRAVIQGPGERGRPMERDEFQALMRSAGQGKGAPRGSAACFRRVLVAVVLCGFRPNELCRLEWSFLNLDRAEAILLKHKTRHARKDRAPRIVTLHRVVVRLLIWLRNHQAPGDRFVFLNAYGRPWNRRALGLRISRLRVRIGLPKDCKLYGARHAFATNLAASGADLATLAEMLGHTTLEMAKYYVHLAGKTEHRQRTIDKMKWT